MNIVVLTEFEENLRLLDNSEQKIVLKSANRIVLAGGNLGKQLSSNLKTFRAMRTGHNSRLRLIFLVAGSTVYLLNIGRREAKEVYVDSEKLLHLFRD